MEGITWASAGAFLASLVSATFNGIVSTLKASYEASHKWFAVGCVVFLALVWFGYAHLPTFSAKDEGVSKQLTEMSKKMDGMASEIDGLKISLDSSKDLGSTKITTGSNKHRHK